MHPASEEDMQQAATTSALKRNNEKIWNFEKQILEPIVRFFLKIFSFLGIK